jgi:hypothetical protein
MNKATSEDEQWTSYLSKWILRGRCPVCFDDLGCRHAIAHIGSCNFNGPNLSNGFLKEVKNRQWQEIIEPFDRLSSMDMMACEVVRCPSGLTLIVWVEVDLAIAGDQYLVYSERIDEYEVSQIQQVTPLNWVSF